MKILFVNRMLGESWGGGENYDVHLARALTRRGHSVTFLTGSSGRDQAPGELGMECITLRTPYLRRFMYRFAGQVPVLPGLAAEADLKIFLERSKATLSRLISQGTVDVVQVLALPYLARWVSSRIPTAMRFPGPPAWFQNELLRRLGTRPRFRMFTHGDAVGHVRDHIGAPITEVAPGIDHNFFRSPSPEQRAAARRALGLRPEDFTLATVGRLIAGKGYEFLLRGLTKAPSGVQLLVAGDGPKRPDYQALAEHFGVAHRVKFLGHLDKCGVARTLTASDGFCLLSEYENFSNATLEAMAVGLPVIASNRGGFPRQVRESINGHLIAYGDDEALGCRIRQWIERPETRQQMAKEAARFARQFSWDRAAEQVESIYAELVS